MAAAGLIGLGVAGKSFFQYNRKSFFLDRKLKQKRFFQEQDMRVEQFGLYREDIRDLVELTTSKMDLYMVVAALLVDKCTMMVCKQDDALPPPSAEKGGSPVWVIALNAMANSTAIFYLLLSLWLAMYASVSAQSFGTRLLTQFVRLPIAKPEQILEVSSKAQDFESADPKEILRVPIIMAERGDPTEEDGEHRPIFEAAEQERRICPMLGGRNVTFEEMRADPSCQSLNEDQLQTRWAGLQAQPSLAEQQADAGRSPADSDSGQDSLMPTAMLAHIQLYRQVQLNWQAFDAYARVSLFCGAFSLLNSVLYWFLGELVQKQDSIVPAFGVSVIVGAVQIVLTRLDLRLRTWELACVAALMCGGTITTTTGIVLHHHLIMAVEGGYDVNGWWAQTFLGICAVVAHVIHTFVQCLILYAAWPAGDRDEEEAFLPNRFKSVLYLDVFGWLMNSAGPGPGVSQPSSNATVPSGRAGAQAASPPASPPGSPVLGPRQPEGSSVAQARRSLRLPVDPRERIGMDAEQQTEARRLLDPEAQPTNAADTQDRWTARRGSNASSSPPSAYRRTSSMAVPLEHQHEPCGTSAGASAWAGEEAVHREVMDPHNQDSRIAATTFAPGPGPRRVRERVPVPGEIPWRAFCHGTSFIIIIWVLATLWACYHSFHEGWLRKTKPEGPDIAAIPVSYVQPTVLHRACSKDRMLPVLRPKHASLAQLVLPGHMGASYFRVRDQGCMLRWPVVDTSVVCERNLDIESGRCLTLLLRQGGRTVGVCRLARSKHGYILRSLASLRLAPGAEPLVRIAGGVSAAPGSNIGMLAVNVRLQTSTRVLEGLRVYGRARSSGALIAFLPSLLRRNLATSTTTWHGQLRPKFTIDHVSTPTLQTEADLFEGEQLFAVGATVLSLTPCTVPAPAPVCTATHSNKYDGGACSSLSTPEDGLQVKTWDVFTGEQTVYRMPSWQPWVQDAAASLQQLCSVSPIATEKQSADFLKADI